MHHAHCSVVSLWLSWTLHSFPHSPLCFWYSQPTDSSHQTRSPLLVPAAPFLSSVDVCALNSLYGQDSALYKYFNYKNLCRYVCLTIISCATLSKIRRALRTKCKFLSKYAEDWPNTEKHFRQNASFTVGLSMSDKTQLTTVISMQKFDQVKKSTFDERKFDNKCAEVCQNRAKHGLQ